MLARQKWPKLLRAKGDLPTAAEKWGTQANRLATKANDRNDGTAAISVSPLSAELPGLTAEAPSASSSRLHKHVGNIAAAVVGSCSEANGTSPCDELRHCGGSPVQDLPLDSSQASTTQLALAALPQVSNNHPNNYVTGGVGSGGRLVARLLSRIGRNQASVYSRTPEPNSCSTSSERATSPSSMPTKSEKW